MPAVDHAYIHAPNSLDQKIWRYLDWPKFLGLLETNQLTFAQLDLMPDKFEGAPAEESIVASLAALPDIGMTERQWRRLANDSYFMNRYQCFVSCWHMSNHESAAMWAQYSNKGIAIRSTYQQLRESVEGDPRPIHVGRVEYANNLVQPTGLGNTLVHVFRKRTYFDYEKELRAVVMNRYPDAGGSAEDQLKAAIVGPKTLQVGVDLHRLVEAVFVSPFMPDWERNLVAQVLERYGLRAPIHPSFIDKLPPYHLEFGPLSNETPE